MSKITGAISKFIAASTIIILLSSTAFAKYSDVPESANYYQPVMNLASMEIINGFSDGSFKPAASVTRAQFVKMMVKAMGNENEAAAVSSSSIFTDIKAGYWATGYINQAVKDNIITGYANGSFMPDENVNFAQVSTVLLRSLGYTSSEMSGAWPQNYIEKAKGLEISKGINLKPSDKVSRAQLSIMLERTLNTKQKNSTQTLAEKSGLGTLKTLIIINTWDIDNSLPKGSIKTDLGDFNSENLNGFEGLGRKVNALINADNKIISAQNIIEDSHIIFVESVSGNRLSYSDKNGTGTIDVPDNLTFYYNNQKTSFKDIKQNVSVGSMLALARPKASAQAYDYGVLAAPPSSEPVVLKKDIGINDISIGTIDISNRSIITVIKNGHKASLTDIKLFDVIYEVKNPYKKGQTIILVYDEKKTGTYDDAIPSKSVVNKIKLLGKEMELETSSVASKLNDSPSAFAIGDQITALTGKSGKIVDVITPSASDISNIAIVTGTRVGVSTESNTLGKDVFYVTLYKTDGTSSEYKVNEDQTDRKGKIVKFDVKDETAVITPISYTPIFGRINTNEKMIGDLWLSQDAVILDINSNSKNVQVKKMTWQDMPTGELIRDEVIHAEIGGAFNDIQLLILNNLTESGQYGILKSKSEGKTSASYTLLINGEDVSYNNVNAIFNSDQDDVVYIEQDEDGLQHMYTISPKVTSYEIQAVDSRRIKINNKVYKISNNVAVYDETNTSIITMSVNELTAGKIGYVELYSGKQAVSQDLIKLIIIKRK